MSKTVVGLLDSLSEAEDVKRDLVKNGYVAEDIKVVANEPSPSGPKYAASSADASSAEPGFMASIKKFFSGLTDANETDREYYTKGVDRGGALITVTVPDSRVEATVDLLEQYGATKVQNQTGGLAAAGTAGAQPTGATGNVSIPIMEEELQIGKRQVNRGGVRVYSRLVETPIEESIQLREEHVRIERKPVDRPATESDLRAFKEGSIELTETAEEAVISKQARVVEEVIVGKEVSDRTQTVKDSVRHTEVNVEELTPELKKKTTNSGV